VKFMPMKRQPENGVDSAHEGDSSRSYDVHHMWRSFCRKRH